MLHELGLIFDWFLGRVVWLFPLLGDVLPKKVATLCHHEVLRSGVGTVRVFGQMYEIEAGRTGDGKFSCCPTCMGRISIRCARCRRTILPGHNVAVCRWPWGEPLPQHATVFSLPENQVVCCVSPHCLKGHIVLWGEWVPTSAPGGCVGAVYPLDSKVGPDGEVAIYDDDSHGHRHPLVPQWTPH